MEVEIWFFRAQTGHPQSSCHLQLHPPCQWTKMTFQTALDQPPRCYHIIPGLCQLVKDQFVAMLASVGEFQTKGCFPCVFCLKWREILGYQNFKVLHKLAEKKKPDYILKKLRQLEDWKLVSCHLSAIKGTGVVLPVGDLHISFAQLETLADLHCSLTEQLI